MSYWIMLKRELKENKEGVIGGGVVGVAIALFLQNKGVTTIMAAGSKGLVDYVAPNLSVVTLAAIKFYAVAILTGMMIGYIVDKHTKFI